MDLELNETSVHLASRGHRRRGLWVAFLAVLLAALLPLSNVSAHGELEERRSSPSPGSVFGTAPTRVDLWFTEPLVPNRSRIDVFDEQRHPMTSDPAEIDQDDPTHLSVDLQPLVDGTYTVAWQSASETDGHVLQGTFTFKVGRARLPSGAATSAGESPSAPAVALRWLTLAALSLVGGWFLLLLLGMPFERGHVTLALGGVVLALLAELGLVPAQALWPANGLPRQPLGEVLSAMPSAWGLRLGVESLLLATVAVAGWHRSSVWAYQGTALTAVVVLLLSFTSHAAALQENGGAALLVNALHLGSVVFWIGGVGYWALGSVSRRALPREPLRRFSRLALILAPVAVATGALNAGLLLPSARSLWASDYGRVLLAKSALVLLLLGAAWHNRRRVQAAVWQIFRLLRSLRFEAALGAAILLAAALLALSAPPLPAEHRPLDLRVGLGENRYAHLSIDNPKIGDQDVSVWLTDRENRPVAGVRQSLLTLSMLERPIDLLTRRLQAQPDGRWTADDVPLTVKGWWQADIQFLGEGAEAEQASFIFLLPDATLFSPERDRASDAEAERLFNQALDHLLSVHSLRTAEVLADGIGNSVATNYEWLAPDRLRYSTSSGNESVAIGRDQYYRDDGENWTVRQRVDPVRFPEFMRTYYEGATGFTLGRSVEVDGRRYQVISFYVPPLRGGESWYIWWIDPDTARLRFEGMSAYYHYMRNSYESYNATIAIDAPAGAVPE